MEERNNNNYKEGEKTGGGVPYKRRAVGLYRVISYEKIILAKMFGVVILGLAFIVFFGAQQ